MKTHTHQGRKLSYELLGKGPTVVLLHGFCLDSRVWQDFKQDLLEENYRVLTIDLPGFGASETANEASISVYAAAVLSVVEAEKLHNLVLIGHSMGGYTALAVAEQAPELLSGLGLFHSHPYADTPAKQEARYKQVEFVQRMGHPLFVKQLIPKLFAEQYARSHPFDVDKLIHRAARYPEKGITDGLLAMAKRPDRSALLKNCPVPVLFIVGAQDTAVPAEFSRKQLALPPVADIHILPKVGHMGMIEAPRQTQLIVRRFADFCYGHQPTPA
ncbi:MAG: alpha/beta hydrolase [Bacteroidetes bacterium]|nr:MAG: alpha/beta hydrolase [Bacteroidota bacterium]